MGHISPFHPLSRCISNSTHLLQPCQEPPQTKTSNKQLNNSNKQVASLLHPIECPLIPSTTNLAFLAQQEWMVNKFPIQQEARTGCIPTPANFRWDLTSNYFYHNHSFSFRLQKIWRTVFLLVKLYSHLKYKRLHLQI